MSKPSCNNCNGCGFTENKILICFKCGGQKCNNIIFKSQYYPYYECTECFSRGNKVLDDGQIITCNLCKGVGIIKNDQINCDSCESSHKFCFCNYYIQPFDTCNDCDGTGRIK